MLDSCARGARWFGGRQSENFAQTIENRAPAGLMTVARRFVEELLVGQRQQGAVAVGLELDRHQRFSFRRGPPGPGEDKPAVRHDLAERPAHIVLLAALCAPDAAIAAADARVGLGQYRLACNRAEPAA